VSALHLIVDPSPVEPALDAAISRALMLRVAAGDLADTLRISRPGASVAFGKRDQISSGYADAVEAARAGGFEATERLAGGRAAVFHEGTIHFSHSLHDPDPRKHVTDRFEETAALVAEAFRGLGVDAHVGEIDGEYCPGEHSVNARGRTKLMGVGQRVVHHGANIGGVIVVTGADRIKQVLAPVYAALDLSWRPDTTGSLADEVPSITWEGATGALLDAYAKRYTLEPAELDPDTLALARTLQPEHLSPSDRP
jgi:octanoyl-[GcvH]:protein N-octanoyltransferase